MWLASTRRLLVTSRTGIEVARDKRSASALSCCGSRCCTSTKPMPVSSGRFLSNSVNASNPPAEAPMPTTGKWFGASPGSWVCLADIGREDVERFLGFNSGAFLWVAAPLETFLRVFDFKGSASLAERLGFGAQHWVIWQ